MTKFTLFMVVLSFDGGSSIWHEPFNTQEECLERRGEIDVPYYDNHVEYFWAECVRTEFDQMRDIIL